MLNTLDSRCVLFNDSIYISPFKSLYHSSPLNKTLRYIDLNFPHIDHSLSLLNLSEVSPRDPTFDSSNGVFLIGNLSNYDETSSIYITKNKLYLVNQRTLLTNFADALPDFTKNTARFPRRTSILQNAKNNTEYILYGGEHLVSPGSELFVENILKTSPYDNKTVLFNSNVMRFNFDNFSWSRDLVEGPWIIDSSNFVLDNKLYLIGGYDLKAKKLINLSTISLYDLETNRWNTVYTNGFLNETRVGHKVALNGSIAYISGGLDDYSDSLSLNSNPVLMFDVLKQLWIGEKFFKVDQSSSVCTFIYNEFLYDIPDQDPSKYNSSSIGVYDFIYGSYSRIFYSDKDETHSSTDGHYYSQFCIPLVALSVLSALNTLIILVCLIIYCKDHKKKNRWQKNNEYLVTKDIKPLWSDPPMFLEDRPNIDLSSAQAFDYENENPYSKVLSSSLNTQTFINPNTPSLPRRSKHRFSDSTNVGLISSLTRVDGAAETYLKDSFTKI